jgi:hypothetical protein
MREKQPETTATEIRTGDCAIQLNPSRRHGLQSHSSTVGIEPSDAQGKRRFDSCKLIGAQARSLRSLRSSDIPPLWVKLALLEMN